MLPIAQFVARKVRTTESIAPRRARTARVAVRSPVNPSRAPSISSPDPPVPAINPPRGANVTYPSEIAPSRRPTGF